MGLVVLTREHDDFRRRVDGEQLLKQCKTFRDRIGVGRQPQVHRYHRRLMSAELQKCSFSVAGSHRLEAVQ